MKEFQATVRDKLAPLIMEMNTNNDIDIDTVTSTFNAALTEASDEVLGLYHPKKKPWITAEILAKCDERRKMKKLKSDSKGAKQYKKINKIILQHIQEAKEKWIEDQCTEMEDDLCRNQTQKAYDIIKNLT